MPIIFGLLDFQLGNLKQVKNLGGGGNKNMPISTVQMPKYVGQLMLCLSKWF